MLVLISLDSTHYRLVYSPVTALPAFYERGLSEHISASNFNVNVLPERMKANQIWGIVGTISNGAPTIPITASFIISMVGHE